MCQEVSSNKHEPVKEMCLRYVGGRVQTENELDGWFCAVVR